MGAPKQKWTPDEEAALKAGVLKHGPGKWRTILKDPEFSALLCLRSNVDLKDKWRNMSVMANGWGSRERARLARKRMLQAAKNDGTIVNVGPVTNGDEKSADPKPIATSSVSPHIADSKRSKIRLDNLIMEAIQNLKEPGGSDKATIAEYIEDEYWAPPNFKRLLSANLKYLTATGKLIKMKRKFRITPNLALSDQRRPFTSLLEGRTEGRQRISPVIDHDDMGVLTRPQVDLELANMRNMTPEEAAAAAAQAVAEAEAAIAEAEEAAREADAAEADAEAAHAFAEAAMSTLKGSAPRMMVLA